MSNIKLDLIFQINRIDSKSISQSTTVSLKSNSLLGGFIASANKLTHSTIKNHDIIGCTCSLNILGLTLPFSTSSIKFFSFLWFMWQIYLRFPQFNPIFLKNIYGLGCYSVLVIYFYLCIMITILQYLATYKLMHIQMCLCLICVWV